MTGRSFECDLPHVSTGFPFSWRRRWQRSSPLLPLCCAWAVRLDGDGSDARRVETTVSARNYPPTALPSPLRRFGPGPRRRSPQALPPPPPGCPCARGRRRRVTPRGLGSGSPSCARWRCRHRMLSPTRSVLFLSRRCQFNSNNPACPIPSHPIPLMESSAPSGTLGLAGEPGI